MQEIFSRIGAQYGFETVEVEFSQFKDFRIKWSRTNVWINLKVSDYLKGMPKDAVEGLATALFEKMKGNMDTGYGDVATAYLTSDGFVEKNQKKYIARHKLTEDDEGIFERAYESLLKDGLVEYEPFVAMRWGDIGRGIIQPTALMRVAVINEGLKCDGTMEEVRFALYLALKFISYGMNKEAWAKDKDDIMRRFPNASEIAEGLEKKYFIV